jgi:hypothetical protein
VRRRRGGLRVYLDRPWFSSGDGEQLGVVIAQTLLSPRSDNYPYVTLIGRDPVRAGGELALTTPQTFPNAAIVSDQIAPLDLAAEKVTIAAFSPAFDPGFGGGTRGAWYCDIDVSAGGAYMPFIRLALVRYQPNALEGSALSKIVTADIVQTMPERTLTVARTGTSLDVTVAGPGYTAIKGLALRSDDAALGRVVARIESRDASVPDQILSWRPVPGSESALTRTMSGNTASWTGTMPIPTGDGSPMRLTVVEEESFVIEAQGAGQPDLAARVVYADAVDL